MQVRISTDLPPNWDRIQKEFPHSNKEETVVAYGGTIYSKYPMSDHLIAHEKVHLEQQEGKPEAWWELYFTDKDFRLQQELEAYKKQIQFFKTQTGAKNNDLFKFKVKIAKDISSPLYGNMISFNEALQKFKEL